MNVRFKQFVSLITNFLFSLKNVNTVYYTTSVPKASQNVTFFLRTESVKIVCRQRACNNHAIKFTFNISVLQYINDFNFRITVRLIPSKLCLQIGLVYQLSMPDELLARENKNISDKTWHRDILQIPDALCWNWTWPLRERMCRLTAWPIAQTDYSW